MKIIFRINEKLFFVCICRQLEFLEKNSESTKITIHTVNSQQKVGNWIWLKEIHLVALW